MTKAPFRQNLWDLAVLALLREKPMHPYEMQRLIHERHKDELLDLKRGSLYHATNRLLELILIEAVGTERNGRRPERTTYRITRTGRQALTRWIQEMLSAPTQGVPEMIAALSFLVYLTPQAALPRLEQRMQFLEKSIADRESGMLMLVAQVKRINLIEGEYLCALHKAELAWVRNLAGEIRSGQFSWNLKTTLREAQAEKRQAADSGKAR